MNECRLSPSGEESSPVELRSRDVIQFGVNVNVEKKGKCIKRLTVICDQFCLMVQ